MKRKTSITAVLLAAIFMSACAQNGGGGNTSVDQKQEKEELSQEYVLKAPDGTEIVQVGVPKGYAYDTGDEFGHTFTWAEEGSEDTEDDSELSKLGEIFDTKPEILYYLEYNPDLTDEILMENFIAGIEDSYENVTASELAEVQADGGDVKYFSVNYLQKGEDSESKNCDIYAWISLENFSYYLVGVNTNQEEDGFALPENIEETAKLMFEDVQEFTE